MGFEGVEAIANEVGMLDGNNGLSNDVGTTTTSDVGIGLLAIFMAV